jgi:hypothetical protein
MSEVIRAPSPKDNETGDEWVVRHLSVAPPLGPDQQAELRRLLANSLRPSKDQTRKGPSLSAAEGSGPRPAA